MGSYILLIANPLCSYVLHINFVLYKTQPYFQNCSRAHVFMIHTQMWRKRPQAQARSSRFMARDHIQQIPSIFWSAFGQLQVLTRMMPSNNRPRPQPHGLRPIPGEAQMDEIVCANTAFRYWRCPPQVRDLYPRLPNSEEGWRALSQAPFVTDVLKTPIIAVASPGCCNHHSGLRSTIRWEGASICQHNNRH